MSKAISLLEGTRLFGMSWLSAELEGGMKANGVEYACKLSAPPDCRPSSISCTSTSYLYGKVGFDGVAFESFELFSLPLRLQSSVIAGLSDHLLFYLS